MKKVSFSSEFCVGRSESLQVQITEDLIDRFVDFSGDINALHMSKSAAVAAGFGDRVAHGVIAVTFISNLIGNKLPGKNAFLRSLYTQWLLPLFPGDTLTLDAEIRQSSAEQLSMVLDIKGQNQSNSIVLRGEAAVGLLAAENIAIDSVSGADAQSIPVPKQGGKRPVLVTGGSGAIGGATALALAKMGHPVALGYRRGLEAAEMVASQVHDGGGIAFPLALDLGDAAAIRSAVKHAERELGPFVGLVHSATPPIDHSSVAELKWDVLERFMKVYIQSGLELSQLIYPAIKENGWGRILLMGTSAIMGAPPTGMSAYTIAKSALWGMTKALAVEWGAIGATANMVSPGLIVTPLTQSVSKRARLVEAQRNPRRRLAQENDVARLAAYLFSDAAEYINGVNLPLTGGLPICP